MTDYAFETITAAQALAITAGDRVVVGAGTARQTTVLFLADGNLSVTIEARTVSFGAAFAEVSRGGGIVYPDGSRLHVGTAGADTRDFGVTIASTGAVYAGDGGDTITSGAGPWLLQGNQGADALFMSSGYSNTVYGGQGDDAIGTVLVAGAPPLGQFAQGNRGADSINGGATADTLLGGQGDDRILGNLGQDFINGNLGDDTLFGEGQLLGEGGADTITAGSTGPTTANGGDGDDRISASSSNGGATGGRNVLLGDLGADTLSSASPDADQIFGGDGDDSISNNNTHTQAGDLLDGGAGNDSLLAQGGDDTLRGGDGADSLDGGAGANRLEGGLGADYLLVRTVGGAHLLDGGEGDDSLFGGTSADTLSGGAGNDRIVDTDGDGNRIDGGDGDDRITIGGFRDIVLGGEGADTINALAAIRPGLQSISGGGGADSIVGTTSFDTLNGDAGADTIDGGGGQDILFGGAGADRFLMVRGGSFQQNALPQVRGWSSEDSIQFTNVFELPPQYSELNASAYADAIAKAQAMLSVVDNAAVAIQLGSDVIVFSGLTVGSIDTAILLVGRSLNDISAANIV